MRDAVPHRAGAENCQCPYIHRVGSSYQKSEAGSHAGHLRLASDFRLRT